MKKQWLFAFFVSFCLSSLSVSAIEVKHAALRSGSVLDQYSVELLRFLIELSGEKADLQPYSAAKAQTRKELQIQEGDYDVDWLGATAEIESRITPIRFPILRGLLGHRVFITNNEVSAKLQKGMPLAELQAFKVIQGQGWGDVPILEGGGFVNMKTVANFESIFKLVDGGRADLFPRSVIEPYGELGARCALDEHYRCSDKNMLVDDKLLVVYKLPMYFFVSPKRQDLIDLLNNAFTHHYDQFLEFFNNHALVKDSLKKLEGRTVYTIEKNASLSDETNALAEQFWLKL